MAQPHGPAAPVGLTPSEPTHLRCCRPSPPPPFQPFLSNSTASWWNKRWDIAAGNTLRAVVFDPICERRWVADRKVAPARPGALMQLLASCASFGTSGLIHEGIYWRVRGWGLGKQVLGCTVALEGGRAGSAAKMHCTQAGQCSNCAPPAAGGCTRSAWT